VVAKSNLTGYSLLELMLTIAVIVIVVGLLLPAITTARGKVKKTVCTIQRDAIMRYDEQTDRLDLVIPTPVLAKCYECHIPNRYRQPPSP